ncbi:CDP-alcohol phosphatidyltransferase family protein [Sulfitobacter guttiformis]|uniref:CDP-diacylglycerol--serine O-phosphatidyltransferase n=1 Tax=Sulfitobacter guttiformis TaxID=74349 RepID=A0A420DMQ9_9RHOB|nr:CDP-alcohol phosphatidyltransferase family protein [Sulfitobacter guttiformis]KIN72798.1 putative CDP-diacylglycerol-serine O-phosphatidyltransferase [Sulfitobacter guttiformis KCTC 32187]RKE95490.1 CDP-diacylglycerol--serine O-phosphatidyltransferase [Sulfitobacter guttiformis]
MTAPSRIKLRHIVPSMVTVFAICAGMTAVRMNLEGRIELSLYFVLLAVFLDAADGKLARFLDSASPFGAELDTLADFFNFGIVPGMLLYNTLYIGTAYASLGWLAILVLAVCCALRLARFNLSLRSDAIALKQDDYFVGVPAPALACLALMPVFMHLNGWENTNLPVLRALYIIGVGLLAVSTIPTISIKHASIKRAHLPFVMVAAVLLVVGLMVYTWPTMIAVNCLYLLSLPAFYWSQHKKS